MEQPKPEICTRCGFMLNRHGMCARPECSSNRPTKRPPSSKPITNPRADPSLGEIECVACHGVVPAKARYCPYCRAPRRASATIVYAGLEQAMFRPPRVPDIPTDEESSPHESGTRRIDGGIDADLEEYLADPAVNK